MWREDFFEAPMHRDVCIELPVEALAMGEGTIHPARLLEMSPHRTRDAATNRQDLVVVEIRRLASNEVRVGSTHDVEWFREKLDERSEIKTKTVGPGVHGLGEARLLNRFTRCTLKGWEYEADQRYAEILGKDLDFEGAKPIESAGEHEQSWEVAENSVGLCPPEASKYRQLPASANYLARDRPDT